MRLTEKVRRLFGGNPRRVQAAALPWRRSATGGRIEILLVTSRDTGRWVLPKGWPEGAESLSEAAVREAREEAGIKGRAHAREIGRFYYSKLRGSGVEWRCEVAIVPLEVTRELAKWPERKRRTRQWFAARDAAALVDEPDLAELLLRFADNPREIAA
ncbi:NUDIX hydrolase [Nitratireductor pacificus]|uniref:NUDIX hydrolase n=1 Tax=Nitratireductor pacificus pht-3B TaxID=391937 RepID=K2MJS3_9HYPH|nr:NUDIX hydrolase [Nitratireductor pacificus]EKF20965.1 NUDIX hydrolase [Nitratireductor pacificus pht-3B]